MWGTSIHDMNTGHIGQGIKARRDFRDHPAENDAFIENPVPAFFLKTDKENALNSLSFL